MHVSRHVSPRGLKDTRSVISRRVTVTCVTTVESPTVQGTVVTLFTAESSGTAVTSHRLWSLYLPQIVLVLQ